jgi:cytidine deaminase
MDELTEYCCDVCGDKARGLRTLNAKYSSNIVSNICGDCLNVMEEFQSNVRVLMTKQECSLIKLFMRKQRRNKFKKANQ